MFFYKTCLFFSFLSLLFFSFSPLDGEEALPEPKPLVLVSIAPYKYFVDQISGGSVAVQVMVPAGANAHAYEPTPKQMIQASRAVIWFILGESFERRAFPVVKGSNPNLKKVDLREGIELISHSCSHSTHCHPDAKDLHIWLSPRLSKKQAEAIAEGLQQIFPEKSALFQKNLHQFLQDLDKLDKDISLILAHPKNSHILVSHPSFAYFCRDYHLEQLSVEFEGKDPTPKQLTDVIEKARKYRIDRIFIQKQFSSKGARIVAGQLQAKIIEIDPYSENYFSMMHNLALEFSGR
jgi:zinc transport system substrate-binding protein